MAQNDRFMIAPYDEGIRQDVKPFLIPDNAFESIKNAYVFRGRVRKRFGSFLSGQGATSNLQENLYSRLAFDLSTLLATTAIIIGKTDGAGAFNGYMTDGAGFHIGQKIVIGAATFDVSALGTPAFLWSGGAPTANTINTNTGLVAIAGAAAVTDVVWYPYNGCTGITNGAGVVTGWIPGKKYAIGQQFSIGDVVFTIKTLSTVLIPNPQMLRTDGSVEVATFNTDTGEFNITIAALPNTHVFYYPGDPVMGLSQYETIPINNQIAYAFDTQYVYYYNGGRWLYSGPGDGLRFHGTDSEFFYTCNYQGQLGNSIAMFVTNNHILNVNGAADNTDDPMYYFDGTAWTIFRPKFKTAGVGNRIQTCKIILPFKRRLLCLNTIERDAADAVNSKHGNRCRFSWDGSPIDGSAFIEPNQVGFKGGGWVDNGTEEEIIGAEYIKDRLIVYFERSTWELVYTGNEVDPFVWQKLNSELGSESTFAAVPFDKMILNIGNNGITACNGSNVERIDNNIPDYIYQFNNASSGVARIQGVRDYKTEMVYWTVPISSKMSVSYFPNTVLVYNYKNGTWAENDDCITCWGYFEQSTDKRWQDMHVQWKTTNVPWNAYVIQAQERLLLAGNQQGCITIINPNLAINANNLLITDLTHAANVTTLTIMNHTLKNGDFIELYNNTTNDGMIFGSDSKIYEVTLVDKDKITISDPNGISGTYLGSMTASRVSVIDIKTKQWNFYLKDGAQFLINKMDFMVTKGTGDITTDFHINSSQQSLMNDAFTTGSNLGSYRLGFEALDDMSATQERIWNSVYFNAEGSTIQLHLYYDKDQIMNVDNAYNFFELHAIMIYAKKTRSTLTGVYNGY